MSNSFKTLTFKVEMNCEGCSNAINNVLNKHKGQGIKTFNVDLKKNKVTVETSLPVEKVMEILQKTGKKVTHQGN